MLVAAGLGLEWALNRLWGGLSSVGHESGSNTLATRRDLILISKELQGSPLFSDLYQKIARFYQGVYPSNFDPAETLACKLGLVLGGSASMPTKNPLPLAVASTLCLHSVEGKDTREKPGTVKWLYCPSGVTTIYSQLASENAIYLNEMVTNFTNVRIEAINKTTGRLIWMKTGNYEAIAEARGVLYSYRQIPQDVFDVLYALNASTGETMWQANKNIGFVAASGGMVFGYRLNNQAESDQWLAINASTGRELWNFNFSACCLTFPTLSGDMLIGPSGNGSSYEHQNYAAVNASTGELIWQIETDGIGSPATVLNGRVNFFDNTGLHALDARTGLQIWSFANVSNCGAFSSNVAVACNETGFYQGINPSSGKLMWNSDISRWSSASTGISIYEDCVYVVGMYLPGSVLALNATTGQLLWERPKHWLSWQFIYAFTFGNGQIDLSYERTDPSENQWVNAVNPATGRLIWQFEMNSTPANLIYSDGILYAYDECLYALRT